MIVIRLMGGLGNQLFQYAAGRQLADRYNTELFFADSWFKDRAETDTQRQVELEMFSIPVNLAPRDILDQLGGTDFSLFGKWKTIFMSGGKYRKAKFYKPGYDEDFDNIKNNTYIKGYFQSEKYFKAIAGKLRDELSFRDEAVFKEDPLYKKIKSSISVSLHVRRGDYVGNAAHGICTKAYYEKAIRNMKEKLGTDFMTYVFSDDPGWVREKLNLPNTVIVDNSGVDLKNIDLFLMAGCDHHIIANSSYSWWAAWLNPSKDKTVLAPEWWTKEHKTSDIDLLFEGMKIIE